MQIDNDKGTSKSSFFHWLLLISAVAVSCFGFDAKKIKEKELMANDNGFSVIELFTSEGCSSCPPADDLVAKILAEKQKDVYILSYHVDYWNRLGWKDEFSKAAYSNRQRQYANHLSLNSVYTPQIIVNGAEEFVGSNETRLRNALLKSTTDNTSPIEINAIKTECKTVHVSYHLVDAKSVLLNIALVQPEAITMVKSGENAGRKLHHVNIVRELTTLDLNTNSGKLEIVIPDEVIDAPLKLIAFSQQKSTFKIMGVTQIELMTQLNKTAAMEYNKLTP
jgi:hypothetical protein